MCVMSPCAAVDEKKMFHEGAFLSWNDTAEPFGFARSKWRSAGAGSRESKSGSVFVQERHLVTGTGIDRAAVGIEVRDATRSKSVASTHQE
jgi:hypothetical protein